MWLDRVELQHASRVLFDCWRLPMARRFMGLFCFATLSTAVLAAEPERREWKIDGETREALTYLPESSKKSETPILFAFHGHGGNMKNSATKFAYHKLWPEAISVYMQGLPTPGKFDPEGKKSGWQKTVGDQKDRDLVFFDEVFKTLKKEVKIDEKRVFATGHSNGGGFTYLLWSARGDQFAALAPSAAGGRLKGLTPKPILHIAGEKDTTVPFENQKLTMAALQKLNQTEENGEVWQKLGLRYRSKEGNDVITYIHPGDHTFPSDAAKVIVEFFKKYGKK
jgi:polyhydroxybutyrate depolymerase